MAKKLSDLLKEVLTKAGFDLKDAKFANLLAVQTDVDDNLFDEIKTGIDNNLMDLNGARNHPVLNSDITKRVLTPVEKIITTLLDEYKLDDLKNELATEKSTYKKLESVIPKLLEKAGEKSKGSDADKQKLLDEIKRLNSEKAAADEAFKKQIDLLKSEYENNILNYAVGSVLESKNYALENLPKKVNAMTALNLLNSELQTKGAKLVRTADGAIKLVRNDNPELEYMESNKPVQFDSFVDSLLAKNNLLKVSDPNPKKVPGKSPIPIIPVEQANEQVATANNKHLEALNASLS